MLHVAHLLLETWDAGVSDKHVDVLFILNGNCSLS